MIRLGGIEKLPGKHAGITEAKVQPFIHLVFGNHVEFVADVSTRAGMGRNHNRPTAGVEVVI